MSKDRQYLDVYQVAEQDFHGLVSWHAIRRYMLTGIGRPRIKLDYVRIGKRLYTWPEAVDEFKAAIQNPAAHTHRKQSERTAKAVRELERAGA